MKVVLFPDLKIEGWRSMDLYAARLWQHLPDFLNGAEVARADARLPRLLGQRRVPLESARYFCRYIAYPAVARSARADVYHVLDHSYGHLVGTIDPDRTVVTLHDLYPLHVLTEPVRSVRHKARNALLRSVMKHTLRVARLIVNSRFIGEELCARTDYPKERVRFIPLGVDDFFFQAREERQCGGLRERLRIGADQALVLHVGSCDARKGIPTLLETCRLLRHQFCRSLRLVQVGGRFTPEHRVLIERLGLHDAVVQYPRVSASMLRALYHTADVLIFPSIYEGFGIPLLEAMAAGTPIVASRIGPFSELVGEFGSLVDVNYPEEFARVTAEVLTNASIAQERAARARARAREFSWLEMTRRTVAVYRELYPPCVH